MVKTISLRPSEPTDELLLYEIYASTREDELGLVDWTDEQKAAFLRQQFSAQHSFYHGRFADARFDLILQDGVPIGRLYVARWPEKIQILDIALLPPYRNAGIGTWLLRALLTEAAATGKRASIYVERFNPARRLYERLGFSEVADEGVYLLLECSPR
jgi:GNAT superfamily N-acetyltransferase